MSVPAYTIPANGDELTRLRDISAENMEAVLSLNPNESANQFQAVQNGAFTRYGPDFRRGYLVGMQGAAGDARPVWVAGSPIAETAYDNDVSPAWSTKRTTGFRPTVVFVVVNTDGHNGARKSRVLPMASRFDGTVSAKVWVEVSDVTVDVFCAFEADGYTLTKSGDAGGDVDLDAAMAWGAPVSAPVTDPDTVYARSDPPEDPTPLALADWRNAHGRAALTNHAGPAAPEDPFDGMLWADTMTGWMRQSVEGDWAEVFPLGGDVERPMLAIDPTTLGDVDEAVLNPEALLFDVDYELTGGGSGESFPTTVMALILDGGPAFDVNGHDPGGSNQQQATAALSATFNDEDHPTDPSKVSTSVSNPDSVVFSTDTFFNVGLA